MQIIGDIFNLIFLGPIINLLVLIVKGLQSINFPGALGMAIIILTIIIRLLIWPFMAQQLRSAKKMADLKPHLDELKKKHDKDKQALAQAQMALYKEHGVNPAGGCLPALIQIPIVIALYQAILAIFEGTHGLERINNLLYNESWRLAFPPDPNFLGLNMGAKPAEFISKFTSQPEVALPILLVPIITGLLQFFQSKMMYPEPVKKYPSDSPKEKKEKQSTEDAMAAMQGQMMFLMPVMIGYFAFTFPLGLALYWNTFTILGIWQQYQISGWGGLGSWLEKLKLKV